MKTFIFFAVLFLSSTVIITNAHTQSSFNNRADFSVGSNPFSLSYADFNLDGKPDLVSANYSSGNISVILNTSSPGASTSTFSSTANFIAGSNPASVSTSDFNGDGFPDIVSANYSSNSISVYLNTSSPGASTPSFSSKTDFSTGINPQGITSGDINGDGIPDIIASNYTGNSVSVFINTTPRGASTPAFNAGIEFTTSPGPTFPSVGDLNGDGKEDILTADYGSGKISVLLNTTAPGSSTPSFSSKTDFTAGNNPHTSAVGDLNGDGMPDIAVTNFNSGTVSVFLNTALPGASTASFSAKTDFATGGTSAIFISIGDINRDGKPDLCTAQELANTVSIFLNTTTPGNATPSFYTREDFSLGGNPRAVILADLNGDYRLNFATCNNTGNSISVLLNVMGLGTTPAMFSAKTDFSAGSYSISQRSADINLDGKPHLVNVNYSSDNFSVFLNTTSAGSSTPTFSVRSDFSGGVGPASLTLCDVNNDGLPDVAMANQNVSTVSIYLNTTSPGASTPTFSAKTEFGIGNNASSIIAEDFNKDGLIDLASTSESSNNFSVLLNQTVPGASTPSFSAKTDFTTGSFPYSISSGDFNNDGKIDVVTSNQNSSTVSVFLNTTAPGASTPSFTAKTDLTIGTDPSSVSCGDINGDGSTDIAAANFTSNTISVFINTTPPGNSSPTFSAKTDLTGGGSPLSISIGDLNGDGKPDFAEVNDNEHTISVFLNSTSAGALTPSFITRVDFSTGNHPYSSLIKDMNADGKPDLVSGNSTTNTLSVLLNDIQLPLPVEIASFTVSVDHQNVNLNWSTTQEQNNSGFDVERNSFGTAWQKIGAVQGAGSTHNVRNYSYRDLNLSSGHYSYRLKQLDYNGNFKYYELSNEVIVGIPAKFSLSQNYPNPFNPVTKINYSLPVSGMVSLKIYDITGREVASPVNEIQQAGYFSISFNASGLSSGTYFYQLKTENNSITKKMMIVK